MKYMLIKGVREVEYREQVKGKEWRFYIVDGNGNFVPVEADRGLVSKAVDMMEGKMEVGVTLGEVVE